MISNKRSVLFGEVSVGVNSKERLLRSKLYNKHTCFMIPGSLIAVNSKYFLGQLKRC